MQGYSWVNAYLRQRFPSAYTPILISNLFTFVSLIKQSKNESGTQYIDQMWNWLCSVALNFRLNELRRERSFETFTVSEKHNKLHVLFGSCRTNGRTNYDGVEWLTLIANYFKFNVHIYCLNSVIRHSLCLHLSFSLSLSPSLSPYRFNSNQRTMRCLFTEWIVV